MRGGERDLCDMRTGLPNGGGNIACLVVFCYTPTRFPVELEYPMIEQRFIEMIASEVGVDPVHAAAAVGLLDKGATAPFIARYRKDVVGGLEELQIEAIERRNLECIALTNRRDALRANVQAAGRMTESLEAALDSCTDPLVLEDLYLPFKKQRHSKAASVASQRGLDPFADYLWMQVAHPGPVDFVAESYVNPEHQILSKEEVLDGGRHILAERLACDHEVRRLIRERMWEEGRITAGSTKYAGEQRKRFEQYFEYAKPLKDVDPATLLTLLRGARIGVLRVELVVDEDVVVRELVTRFVKEPGSSFEPEIEAAVRDAYRRLLWVDIESQVMATARRIADERLVASLRGQVEAALMAPPVGPVPVIAVHTDRAGTVTLAAVNERGECVEATQVESTESETAGAVLAVTLPEWMERHGIRAVTVGHSGPGRQLARSLNMLLREKRINGGWVAFAGEAGLSAYSVSPQAVQEMPNLDPPKRAAVSLGRRFQDPMAEMLKVEPRALAKGVQAHDVNQRRLQEALFRTAEYCVNRVGLDLNTAPLHLLRFVCGIQMGTAQNLLAEREKLGRFTDRTQLVSVSGIGEKTCEQCAGFLRITGGAEPLDGTRIHPEAYTAVKQAAEAAGVALTSLPVSAKGIDFSAAASAVFGSATMADWAGELGEPAKDFRGRILAPVPRKPVRPAVDMSTVQEGAVIEGKVTNLTEFGAFIDFGMGKEGLVHLSEMAPHFVKDASEVLQLGQVVKAKIIKVDPTTKRISLSIRALLPPPAPRPEAERPQGEYPERRRPSDQPARPRSGDEGSRRGPAPRGARRDDSSRDRPRESFGGDRGDRRPPRERDAARTNAEPGGTLMNTLLADQLASLKDKLLSE